MAEQTNLAQMRAKSGRSADLGAALESLVAPSLAEPGCIIYQVHRSIEDPDRWMVYEIWSSAAALEEHFTLPHMQVFAARLPELIEGELDLQSFTRVGSAL